VDKTDKMRHFLNSHCPNVIKPLLPETQTCDNAKVVMHFVTEDQLVNNQRSGLLRTDGS
jgi:hypothetical protein